MQVLAGNDQLSRPTDAEKRALRKEKKPDTDRISCNAFVNGDCTVTTTYW